MRNETRLVAYKLHSHLLGSSRRQTPTTSTSMKGPPLQPSHRMVIMRQKSNRDEGGRTESAKRPHRHFARLGVRAGGVGAGNVAESIVAALAADGREGRLLQLLNPLHQEALDLATAAATEGVTARQLVVLVGVGPDLVQASVVACPRCEISDGWKSRRRKSLCLHWEMDAQSVMPCFGHGSSAGQGPSSPVGPCSCLWLKQQVFVLAFG